MQEQKFYLRPLEQEESISYGLTPKGRFMSWCVQHQDDLIAMVIDFDFDILDRLWPGLMELFSLDERGYHAGS